MKDKVARELIDQLAGRIGCEVVEEHSYLAAAYEIRAEGGEDSLMRLRQRVRALELAYDAQKEAAKPECPTCGQKVQEGFRIGQIEQVAAAVRKTDKRR